MIDLPRSMDRTDYQMRRFAYRAWRRQEREARQAREYIDGAAYFDRNVDPLPKQPDYTRGFEVFTRCNQELQFARLWDRRKRVIQTREYALSKPHLAHRVDWALNVPRREHLLALAAALCIDTEDLLARRWVRADINNTMHSAIEMMEMTFAAWADKPKAAA